MGLPLLATVARLVLGEVTKSLPKVLARKITRGSINKILKASVIRKSGATVSTKAIKSILKRTTNPIKIAKWQTVLQYKTQQKFINKTIRKINLARNIVKNPAKVLTSSAIKKLPKNSIFRKANLVYKKMSKLPNGKAMLKKWSQKLANEEEAAIKRIERAIKENYKSVNSLTSHQKPYFYDNVIVGKNSGALVWETKSGKYIISQDDAEYDEYLDTAMDNTYITGSPDELGMENDE